MKSKLSLKRVPYNIFKIQIVNLNTRGKNTISSTRVDMSTGQAFLTDPKTFITLNHHSIFSSQHQHSQLKHAIF